MSEYKGTPGPWELMQVETHPHFSIDPKDEEASLINIDGHGLYDVYNAFLITAAPELLEACRWIVSCDEEGEIEGGTSVNRMLKAVHAAIAKATP